MMQIMTIIDFGILNFCKLDISSPELPVTIHVTSIISGMLRANIFKIIYIKAILPANKFANRIMAKYVITNLIAFLYSLI